MGESRTDEPRRTNRLTVQQAAAHLGISEGAIRNRIKRGTPRAERKDGRVYVLLAGPANHDESNDESQLVAFVARIRSKRLRLATDELPENFKITS